MNKIIFLAFIVILLLFLYYPREEPSQSEIQSLVHYKKKSGDFIFPQISHGFQQLSNKIIKPLNNIEKLLPNNDDNMNIIRTSNRDVSGRFYVPEYYRKDTLNSNDIGSEELREFLLDETKNDTSWSDTNISQHPKYYTSDFKNNLTNPGTFFNNNNQYNDTTSSKTEALPSDNCYIAKNGLRFCKDKTRIQNVPPKLINDEKSLSMLERVGTYSFNNNDFKIFSSDEKLYDNVEPSKRLSLSEKYVPPLSDIISSF